MSTDTLPKWDLETEYPSISSPQFQKDESDALALIASMNETTKKIRPSFSAGAADVAGIQKVLKLWNETMLLVYNMRTYTHCEESTDATNKEARVKSAQLDLHVTAMNNAFKPVQMFLSQCDQATFEKVIDTADFKASKYFWSKLREEQSSLLSEKEEILLSDLATPGMKAWSDLYTNLTGTMKVKVEINGKTEEVGMAHAAGMAKGSDEPLRKAAWQGIQQAWRNNQESAAAILNSITAWRDVVNKHRSHKTPRDYLTSPLFSSRIERETLNAMMSALYSNREAIQSGVRVQARMLNKNRLDPWDLLAPAPIKGKTSIPYKQAIEHIRQSFSKVDKSFGEFVTTMDSKNWIDARISPNRTTGGYCTGFAKSRTPRVFLTYMGSSSDIGTLAHEIGHAFHSWVMRDLSYLETNYPMTLAETASIFAETVFNDEMKKLASTPEDRLNLAWDDMERAQAFLLNIPARFEFEVALNEKRKEKTLSADDLRQMTNQAWEKWYGDTLSSYDEMFWATKLHFSMSFISFYNFPYTFGYLFSLSIYARRKELGDKFMPKYLEILRDTGRMNAEDLIMKHLGEDIRQPQFWQKAIDVVKEKVENFKVLSGSGSA